MSWTRGSCPIPVLSSHQLGSGRVGPSSQGWGNPDPIPKSNSKPETHHRSPGGTRPLTPTSCRIWGGFLSPTSSLRRRGASLGPRSLFFVLCKRPLKVYIFHESLSHRATDLRSQAEIISLYRHFHGGLGIWGSKFRVSSLDLGLMI